MQTPQNKRHAFQKDLDKLLNPNYVLVPIKLNDEMLNMAMTIYNNTPHGTPASTLIERIWATLMIQAQNSKE